MEFLNRTGLAHLWDRLKSRTLPAGGALGAVLRKTGAGDYETEWAELAPGKAEGPYELPLVNGWSHAAAGGWGRTRYWKSADGFVHLHLSAIRESAVTLNSQQIATMPAGFRPVGGNACGMGYDYSTNSPLGALVTTAGVVEVRVIKPTTSWSYIFIDLAYYAGT